MVKKSQQRSSKHNRRHKLWKWVRRIAGGVLLLGVLTVIWLRLSPWPGAMIIRYEFNKGGEKTAAALQKHVPAGITEIANQQYRAGDKDAYLDVFYPEGTATGLPTVVWVHGGAWVSGDKDRIDGYLQILSAQGFTAVGVDYSLAPEKRYPTAIFQINDALEYLQLNAERLHIDPNNIFLAGDSAGSNLTAQIAALTTNPAYAQEVDFTPKLQPQKLKGIVLNCGIYKMEELAEPGQDAAELLVWGDREVVWAYSGTNDFSDPIIQQMSPYYYVTKDFPPAFITGGNADPLTDVQSQPLAGRLQELGVSTSTLFYPENHQPALPHEYQFNLDNQDGRNAFNEIIKFLRTHTSAN